MGHPAAQGTHPVYMDRPRLQWSCSRRNRRNRELPLFAEKALRQRVMKGFIRLCSTFAPNHPMGRTSGASNTTFRKAAVS